MHKTPFQSGHMFDHIVTTIQSIWAMCEYLVWIGIYCEPLVLVYNTGNPVLPHVSSENQYKEYIPTVKLFLQQKYVWSQLNCNCSIVTESICLTKFRDIIPSAVMADVLVSVISSVAVLTKLFNYIQWTTSTSGELVPWVNNHHPHPNIVNINLNIFLFTEGLVNETPATF